MTRRVDHLRVDVGEWQAWATRNGVTTHDFGRFGSAYTLAGV